MIQRFNRPCDGGTLISFDGEEPLDDTCSTASYVPTSHPANANAAGQYWPTIASNNLW